MPAGGRGGGVTGSVPGPSHAEAGLPGQGEALGVWLVLKRLRVGVQPGLSSTWNRALSSAPAPLKPWAQSPQHLGASPATSGLFHSRQKQLLIERAEPHTSVGALVSPFVKTGIRFLKS